MTEELKKKKSHVSTGVDFVDLFCMVNNIMNEWLMSKIQNFYHLTLSSDTHQIIAPEMYGTKM